MQIEDNTKQVHLFFIVEMQPNLSKVSANRRHYKISSLIFIVEIKVISC
ncbi:hypothetical protein HMPREF0673_00348 [Leyella stercorea DSM 18206]|uniref:Uncharacterized protein n=1 Tax=Leyella stercorea DSM 18206 TaxID=1002367 RepID=G6AUR3_9BACT|nr:hypothetical protein HMPREF0673_00348 [Leyella stercorea DSM 18206]